MVRRSQVEAVLDGGQVYRSGLVEFNASNGDNDILGCMDRTEKHGCSACELSMTNFGDIKQRQICFLCLSLFRHGTEQSSTNHALLPRIPLRSRYPTLREFGCPQRPSSFFSRCSRRE